MRRRRAVRPSAPASRRRASLARQEATVRRPRRFFLWPVAALGDRDLSFQDCRCARWCAKAALALFALVVFVLGPRSAFAGDPYVPWYTVRSPHFRVHYHAG